MTVAIPTRNRSALLGHALTSVLTQSLADIEVIVADNASTDDTQKVVASFADPRVRVESTRENIGMYDNWTRALRVGTAPYVTVLHDDDVMLPDNLARKVALLDENRDLGIAYSTYQVIDAKGMLLLGQLAIRAQAVETGPEFITRSMAGYNRVHMSTAVIRRSIIGDERLEEGDGAYPDLGLWLRLALRTDFGYIAEPLSAIRLHRAAASVSWGLYTMGSASDHDVDGETIEQHRSMHAVKLRFLERFADRVVAADELRASSRHFLCPKLVHAIEQGAGPDRPLVPTLRLGWEAAKLEPRVLLHRNARRLLAASLAGRRGRALAKRLLPSHPRTDS